MNCKPKQKVIQSEMKSGEPYVATVSAAINGYPEDLVGYTIRAQMRLGNSEGELIGTWEDGDPHLVRDDPAGVVVLTLTAEDTLGFTFTDEPAFLDFLFTKSGGGLRSDIVQVNRLGGVTTNE